MIGLTIVVCFALLEFGLARYYQSTESHIAVTTFDPTLGWRLRSGSYSVKPSYTFRHHQVSINEYGLRNRPVSARAASDTKRIVILGDSFTFASAVPNENTFPVILETILSGGGHYGSYQRRSTGLRHNAKELYIPADGHFSKEGHAVVAYQLATFVIKHSGRD